MKRSIKILTLSLLAVFLLSGAAATAAVFYQIVPDATSSSHGRYEPYSESWSFPLEKGRNLTIDMNTVAIIVEAYDGATLEASFEGERISRRNYTPRITAEETANGVRFRSERLNDRFIVMDAGLLSGDFLRGTLTVRVPRVQLGNFSASTFSSAIVAEDISADAISLSASSGRITAKSLSSRGDLTVETFSGKQELTNLTAPGKAKLSAGSGSITVDGLSAGSIEVSEFSGHMTLSSLDAGQNIALSSSSGRVTLTGIRTGSLDIEQFSGAIELSDANVSNRLKASTSSGRISFDGVKADSVSINAFSGRVALHELTCSDLSGSTGSGSFDAELTQGCSVNIDTFSGGVNIAMPEDAGFTYSFDTFSGALRLETANGQETRLGGISASGVVGDGRHSVEIETSSGGITVTSSGSK